MSAAIQISFSDQELDSCKSNLISQDKVIHISEFNFSQKCLPADIASGNIYALWTCDPNSREWTLRYIGTTALSALQARLRQHLFKKHHDTNSSLQRIKEARIANCDVGISTIWVEPNAARWAIEAVLIERTDPSWNRRRK